MASATLECVCCGRKGFKSERGLTQHQNQNLPCREHMLLKSRGKTVSTSFHAVFKYVPVNASNSQQKSDQLLAKNGSTYVNSSPSKHQMASALDPVDAKRQRMAMNSAETAITTQQIAANGNSSDNDSESGSNDDSTADDFGSAGGDDEETV